MCEDVSEQQDGDTNVAKYQQGTHEGFAHLEPALLTTNCAKLWVGTQQ